MNLTDYYSIGRITRPHGLKGEVTLALGPEAPENAGSLDVMYIDRSGSLVPYFVDTVSVKGTKAYVKFQEVDTHETAAAVSGREVFLPKSTRPATAGSEFYADEVAGFVVRENDGQELGVVADVIRSGLQRLMVVIQGEREILIPVAGPFIRRVDRRQKTIHVELPDGFLDI